VRHFLPTPSTVLKLFSLANNSIERVIAARESNHLMAERHDKSLQDSSGLHLTVVNSGTNQPVVYSGETDALTCTLTNNTGSSISLLAGSKPSKVEIFLPDFYQQDDGTRCRSSSTAGILRSIPTTNPWC
jgi:hypothetical protein